jgi:hypothetical protein
MTLYGGGEPVTTHAAGKPYVVEVMPGALPVVA